MSLLSPPAVSVIVPYRERRAHLSRTLHALALQSFSSFEVIVADDNSAEGIPVLSFAVTRATRLKVVPTPTHLASRPSASRARNRAARKASGAVLLFLDADMIAHPELIANHAQLLVNNPGVVTLGIRLRSLPAVCYPRKFYASRKGLLRWFEREMWCDDERVPYWQRDAFQPRWSCLYSHNFALSASTFWNAGGFDEAFLGCGAEDVEFGFRLESAGVRFLPAWSSIGYHQWHTRSKLRLEHNPDNLALLCTKHPAARGHCNEVLSDWKRTDAEMEVR